MADLLRRGDVHRQYGSTETTPQRGHYDPGSDVCAAVVLAAVRATWTRQETHEALLRRGNLGGVWYQRRYERTSGPHLCDSWLSDRWRTSVATAAASPAAGSREVVLAQVTRYRDAVDVYPWTPRTASMCLRIAHVIADVAAERGSRTVELSTRQIADRAVTRQATAWKTLALLVAAGVVEVVERGQGKRGNVLRLAAGTDACETVSRTTDTDHVVYRATDSVSRLGRHEGFSWRALGPTAARLYRALDPDHPQTTAEVARAVRVHRSTAARGLAKLAAAGMAAVAGGRYVALLITDAKLAAAAAAYGTTGLAAARRALFAVQRAGWRAWLDARAAAREIRRRVPRPTRFALVPGDPTGSPDDREVLVLDVVTGELWPRGARQRATA